MTIAHYHLPGLFEFYELYRRFLPLYRNHPEYFYDWCDIGSIYGAPADCLWGGGRVGSGEASARDVLALMRDYGISPRLTFSNSLLRAEHLRDARCNALCQMLNDGGNGGVILHSDLLLRYLQKTYPNLYFVSSTTKVLTSFPDLQAELERAEFRYVVPDFRLNHALEKLNALPQGQKDKVEFLCNECCYFGCRDRRACYEAVSRKNLGEGVGTVIVIILEMQDRVFVSILESKHTVQVVAETVVHLVWRTVERKPKVTALLKTLQGELVEFVVQLAQSFHLGSSRMKHHLIERHLTKPEQIVQQIPLRITEVTEEPIWIIILPIHHLLDTTFHLLHDGTLILYRRLFSYKV